MSSPNMTAVNEEQPPRLGTPQRLIGTLFSPGETFEDINRKPNWIVVALVAVVIAIGTNFIVLKRLNPDWEAIGRQQTEKRLQRQGKSISDLSPPEREAVNQQIKMGAKISPYIAYGAIAFLPISIVILAL